MVNLILLVTKQNEAKMVIEMPFWHTVNNHLQLDFKERVQI